MNTPQDTQTSLYRFPRPQQSASQIQCNGCDRTWTGSSACHCSGCHRTFTGVTAFDIHRVGGTCNQPESLLTEKGESRLIATVRQYWTGWGLPGDRPVPE